mmetsp:Transcript_3490/g.9648  ORF Transcript_3490/g.9648 Transcript_3490/m.9648 type:complete len:129 (-) Transcript_3490:142-528(-)
METKGIAGGRRVRPKTKAGIVLHPSRTVRQEFVATGFVAAQSVTAQLIIQSSGRDDQSHGLGIGKMYQETHCSHLMATGVSKSQRVDLYCRALKTRLISRETARLAMIPLWQVAELTLSKHPHWMTKV